MEMGDGHTSSFARPLEDQVLGQSSEDGAGLSFVIIMLQIL